MISQWFLTSRASRTIIGPTAAIIAAAVCVGLASGSSNDRKDDERDSDSYTIGLFGDMPYNALGQGRSIRRCSPTSTGSTSPSRSSTAT